MMIKSRADLISNVANLTTFEMRTLNRYYLHSENKRCCSNCRMIYDGIANNFHVKKYYSGGSVGYNVWCKCCKNGYSRSLKVERRKSYDGFIVSKLAAYRHAAKQAGVSFDLTSGYLIQLWKSQQGVCYYSSEVISFEWVSVKGNCPHPMTPSLDRLYPEKGYTIGNVVWCAYQINRMKNEFGHDQFIEMCSKIANIRSIVNA